MTHALKASHNLCPLHANWLNDWLSMKDCCTRTRRDSKYSSHPDYRSNLCISSDKIPFLSSWRVIIGYSARPWWIGVFFFRCASFQNQLEWIGRMFEICILPTCSLVLFLNCMWFCYYRSACWNMFGKIQPHSLNKIVFSLSS